MVIVDSRDQALSLLTAANNHADLAVKLSSLKQAKDILSSLDSSFAADLFPYLADLQRSPYSLVRKFLIEIIEDIALKAIDHCSILVPVLVAFLRDADSDVVRQSIACGRNFFCNVLEEMVLQFQQHGKVDRWLEELWTWMVRFKEGVFSIALEPGPVGTKLLALKFLETYVLLFTADNVDSEKFVEVTRGSGWTFNVSWLSGGHPILDPVALTTDANRTLFVLLDMLQSANSLPGCVTITVVYCLAAIARKRPLHYGTVLSSLLDFNANFETMRGLHNANIQYSLRTAFLGFLRCTYPAIVEIDADDDIVVMLGKQIVVDYQQQKGHEIVLQVLYHLYSLTVSNSIDNSSYSAVLYEKFLLAVVKSLLEAFPASDKSVSRLLGEVPFLPDSALKLLDDLCYSDVFDVTGKEIRDAERVTQGLGVVWSLILGRPNNRQVCLGIALKCAVHSQDDIRGKAIRLVANKLYQLSYISGEIEQFATNMLLSAVDQHAAGAVLLKSGSIDERDEREVGSRDTSTSGSQLLEPRASEIDSMNTESTSNSASVVSFPEAQRLISLFFALCTKKPSLLQLSFDIYGRAPKIVKQAFHRHIPIVIRALGQSYSQLLLIISDPPQGSENLLTLVLQILTQETTPSPDLVATVKHLYETKLKDATILIPMLSSLSKNEVLPIFPRLVDLPLEKFQLALAHILQGSAHTGPALTPAEVLVAIHDIIPEKGGPPLKKITDACSACFEQRTVFTQQVLAKALNQMVDQIPLPLLFMRTVIQAIDAFPTLVDFVMEILSKLVSKQVWRMPKLWVGFLKCVAQTQPHSFPVLLQLPPPQLESALNKYGSLRSSLAAYASQPTTKGSLPRSTLAVLGLANDSHMQQPHLSTLHPTDNSSVQGATLT
ncbi:symplekin-like isoform X13 [Durio zibethinus]|uniref:Symplekin-like isoform X13 n=1 Tax=Durio zibethinus TaxID=66656 RepID=A0A6P6AUS0_DURZI|nr:symplekin-like isoform X13 [Durio zibethinus]